MASSLQKAWPQKAGPHRVPPRADSHLCGGRRPAWLLARGSALPPPVRSRPPCAASRGTAPPARRLHRPARHLHPAPAAGFSSGPGEMSLRAKGQGTHVNTSEVEGRSPVPGTAAPHHTLGRHRQGAGAVPNRVREIPGEKENSHPGLLKMALGTK